MVVSRVLTECSLLNNNIGVESANMLAKIGTEKGIMLSGMKRDQTEVDFSGHDLMSADGILIASDLPFMAVLTTIECVFRAQKREPRLEICTYTSPTLARTC